MLVKLQGLKGLPLQLFHVKREIVVAGAQLLSRYRDCALAALTFDGGVSSSFHVEQSTVRNRFPAHRFTGSKGEMSEICLFHVKRFSGWEGGYSLPALRARCGNMSVSRETVSSSGW